jgi:choline kinase
MDVKAIILSAGQGKRLLPATADLPKCLLRVGHRSILEWQLRALIEAGVRRGLIVTGFGADKVAQHLREVCPRGMRVRTLFNPLYDRADNLVTCAEARPEMHEDFLLLNGDTLIQPAVVERLLTSRPVAVAMAVGHKAGYDADDMKVKCTAGRVVRVGKDLQAGDIDGEAIGVSLFRGDGPRLFRDAIEEMLGDADSARRWYLSAVNLLAGRGEVCAVSVDGLGWAEIDYPQDLPRAAALVSGWSRAGERRAAAVSA